MKPPVEIHISVRYDGDDRLIPGYIKDAIRKVLAEQYERGFISRPDVVINYE